MYIYTNTKNTWKIENGNLEQDNRKNQKKKKVQLIKLNIKCINTYIADFELPPVLNPKCDQANEAREFGATSSGAESRRERMSNNFNSYKIRAK